MRSVAFLSGLMTAGVFACVLSGGAAATTEGTQSSSQPLTQTTGTDVAIGAPDEAFDAFLDRLMHAESAGRNTAKNPRSSALGPFQFINSTFLAVMRQHFPDHVARLSERDILALRTNRAVARRAAEAFSKDNMAYLVDRGLTPTFGHLRLAFLLGPQGAARVLQAPRSKPVAHVLGGSVVAANPFMRRMTVADLVARASRDVSPKEPDGAQRPVVADNAPAAPAAAQPTERIHVASAAPTAPAESEPAQAEHAQPEPAGEVAASAAEATAAAELAAPAAEAKSDAKPLAARPATIEAVHLGSVHRGARVSVINVKCDSRLPSCRRWIDQEVAKLVQVADRGDADHGS